MSHYSNTAPVYVDADLLRELTKIAASSDAA